MFVCCVRFLHSSFSVTIAVRAVCIVYRVLLSLVCSAFNETCTAFVHKKKRKMSMCKLFDWLELNAAPIEWMIVRCAYILFSGFFVVVFFFLFSSSKRLFWCRCCSILILRFVSIFFRSFVSLAIFQASFESHNYVSYFNSQFSISYSSYELSLINLKVKTETDRKESFRSICCCSCCHFLVLC